MFTPLSAVQARSMSDLAVAQLRAGNVAAARDVFAQLAASDMANAEVHMGLARAHHALGARQDALSAVDAALALEPRHIGALVLKGDWLDAQGQATAASFYQAALKCAARLAAVPREWEAPVAHAQAMCDRYTQRFESTLRAHLATVAPRFGAPSVRFAQSLDLLTGHKQIYPSAPRLYYFPELPTVQFFDRTQFPWLQRLEAATDAIRQELLAVLDDPNAFSPYVQSDTTRAMLNKGGMLDNPEWSACFLWKSGQRMDANADRCPATQAALTEASVVQIPGRSPSVLFSMMRPGAHIPAHHGFVNTRLIVHLPLIVPPGCRFRVGNESREWIEGQAWLFDDTIEHEAWNPSDRTRVVLLFEVWRPELDAAERAYVSALFESIDHQRGGVGDWGI